MVNELEIEQCRNSSFFLRKTNLRYESFIDNDLHLNDYNSKCQYCAKNNDYKLFPVRAISIHKSVKGLHQTVVE